MQQSGTPREQIELVRILPAAPGVTQSVEFRPVSHRILARPHLPVYVSAAFVLILPGSE
jgi:hypothetical protein